MKQSAGCLLYKYVDDELRVLLVHPSGWYNRRAKWSIPKGLIDTGETEVSAALRETREETGVICEEVFELGSIDYTKSRKRVHGFAAQVSPDTEATCASWEVDQAEFLPVEDARKCLHHDQIAFIDRLLEHLSAESSSADS